MRRPHPKRIPSSEGSNCLSCLRSPCACLYLGLIRPTRITIPGTEFAGEIIAIGKDVTLYRPGDQVYGYTGLGMGTYAEYLCLSEKPSALASVMARMPANVSYEEAAAVPFGGLEALHSLGQANIQRGQKILIVGAGGSIGTYSVQLAITWTAGYTTDNLLAIKELIEKQTEFHHTLLLNSIRISSISLELCAAHFNL